MNFDEFCLKRNITGNFKESLFHKILSKYSLSEAEDLGEDELSAIWNELISDMYGKAISK